MSKKKAREIEERKRKDRNKVLTVVIALISLVVALFIAYLAFNGGPGSDSRVWHLDSAGLLSFDARPAVAVSSAPVESTQDWTLEEVSYKSFGDDVYALLRIPANVSKPPVVIVLPAASINKEADEAMAKALCSWGYATLTLDERGNNGKTTGPAAMDLQGGYDAFAGNGDPVQYRQVYDVLLGYDYLRSRAGVDGENVAVLGESMGGRFAIIATALEPGLKAAIGISTGPYGLQGNDDASARFIRSIEPASYLSSLPPRKLILFHFTEDSVIPLASGRQLYDAALQPKAWHEHNGTVHGLYSDLYAPDLHEELRSVFGR
ncbi:MAG: Alpha/beta hydrolase family protein [Methanocella sp. PtaU1.Bin125]|nr:MAG: Alpha/beta hydrolase family protein [Methanocella sp. PtaU1.Bin125]